MQTHYNLANMCLKVGKQGSLFCKMYESVKSACHYTIEKCQKGISKLRDDNFEDDQDELDNTVLEREEEP